MTPRRLAALAALLCATPAALAATGESAGTGAASATGAELPSRMARSVVMVVAYYYDPVDDLVKARALGSGLAIASNRVVTNAHVVTDDDGNLADGLAVCRVTDWAQRPTCDAAGRALSVDRDADLAVLAVPGTGALEPAAWAASAPKLGDEVRLVGFPANGGGTVTVTEGTVGGADPESGWMKVDANIDAGNSGGGAFDASGAAVGIPSAASVGYSTLGYVIPADAVRGFLAAEASLPPKAGGDAADGKFAAYWVARKQMLAATTLDDPRFTLENFGRFGFKAGSVQFTPDLSSTAYGLLDEDGRATVLITGTSGGGEPTDGAWARAEAQKSAKGCGQSALGTLDIGGRPALTTLCLGGAKDGNSVVITVRLAERAAAIIVGDAGDGAGRWALARAVEMVRSVAPKDPAPSWDKVKAGPLDAPIPAGFSYAQGFNLKGDLARTLRSSPGGAKVTAAVRHYDLGTGGESAESYLASWEKSAKKDFTVLWAGAGRLGDGTPVLRQSVRDEDSGATTHVVGLVWKDGERVRMLSVEFESADGAAALAAANGFARSARSSRAFAWEAPASYDLNLAAGK